MRMFFSGFLEEDEKIKKIFRRPFIFVLKPFVFWLIFWSIITGLLWFFYPTYDLERVAFYDLNLLWQVSGLIGLGFVLAPWIGWYVNAIIMTNESVVVIDWPKTFVRRSTRIDLHNLDEITTERIGWQSFFLNYGHVIFNKVNGGSPIVVKRMSRPTYIARTIESYREWALDKKNFTEESALKGVLSHLVKRHVGDDGQPEREERRNDRYAHEDSSAESAPVVRGRSKPVRQSPDDIQVEKQLDDTGGIDIDLDN